MSQYLIISHNMSKYLRISHNMSQYHYNISQYVKISENISQYVTISHNIAHCVTIFYDHSARLLSDEWAVLQEEVNGVEDVPCRRVDDAEGPGPSKDHQKWHPDSGDLLDRLFCSKTTCLDIKINQAS